MNKVRCIYNNIPKKLKRSFLRFFLSFFSAWLITIILNDLPFFSQVFINMNLDTFLQNSLVWLTEHQLNILGFETYSVGKFLQIIGSSGIRYEYGCLGIRHFILFSAFILFYFGKMHHKLIYIIIGFILLLIVNSLRGTIISIGQYLREDVTMLVHDISTPILMYSTILILWIYWVNKHLKTSK